MQNWSDLRWPKNDFSAVPYPVFYDREVFNAEQERIFRGPLWCYAALQAEIPNPGDYKSTFVGDTPIVVNRAGDGTVHAFVNRCAHRGTLLVRDQFGNRDDHTCIYHHWCYDLEGNLIGVPFLRGLKGKGGMPGDFRMAEHGLRKLKVATYSEVVFVSFHDDPEPLADYLDEPMRETIDRLFPRPIEVLGYMRQLIPGNWKLYFENLMDAYHGGLLHQFQTTFAIARNTQVGGSILDKRGRHRMCFTMAGSDTEEDAKAGYDGDLAYNDQLKLVDPSVTDLIPEDGTGEGLTMMAIFPSVFFQRLNNTLATRQIKPKRPDAFELYWTYYGYRGESAEMRRARMRQVNLVGPGGLVSMEDGEAGRLVQLGIDGADDEHSLIAMGGTGPIDHQYTINTEVPIRGFWRYYCHLMGYVPEGGAAWPPPPPRAEAAE